MKGNIAGQVYVHAAAPVVSASYDEVENLVRVVGRQVGRTELVVSDERSHLRVPVQCAKYAARVARPLAAGVTGSPASREVMNRAVRAAVGASLETEPGVWASVRPDLGRTDPLGPGETAPVPVRIAAAGQHCLPYVVRRSVAVRNEEVPPGPAELLMVSNVPERLLSQGLWYEGTLDGVQSARLLYHHVNGTEKPGELVVEIWNLGDEMARVHVVAGCGGPSGDESWAGHRAAVQFFGNRSSNSGWIVPVPPQTAAPVLSQRITPGATASGVLALRAVDRGDLRVRLYLSPRRSERMPYPVRAYSPSPLLGRWQYPHPRRELGARYVVGREWTFVTIGNSPLPGLLEGDYLSGNYGVIYDIALDISNPTDAPASVDILLEAAGGHARAVLLVDGAPIQAAVLGPGAEARLARYELAPGEERRVRIETMPEGGSHYPVRLVARAI